MKRIIALSLVLISVTSLLCARSSTARGLFGGAASGALFGGLIGGGRGAGWGALAGGATGAIIGSTKDAERNANYDYDYVENGYNRFSDGREPYYYEEDYYDREPHYYEEDYYDDSSASYGAQVRGYRTRNGRYRRTSGRTSRAVTRMGRGR